MQKGKVEKTAADGGTRVIKTGGRAKDYTRREEAVVPGNSTSKKQNEGKKS